jgi:hypothetical protein
MDRCTNFPCQLTSGHPGLCSSTGDGECFSDAERHARIQSLIAEEDDAAHFQRMLNPEVCLARVDAYLTEQTDRAYLDYYRSNLTTGAEFVRRAPGGLTTVDLWFAVGDARELVRRPLREIQQRKLKGTRTLIHANKILEGE